MELDIVGKMTQKEWAELVGMRIKLAREVSGRSVAELSRESGVSESTIRSIENGQESCQMYFVALLGDVLQTGIDWFAGSYGRDICWLCESTGTNTYHRHPWLTPDEDVSYWVEWGPKENEESAVPTMNINIVLETQICSNCGIAFAVTQSFLTARREDGETFCCPNGHETKFEVKESEELKLRAELAEKECELKDAAKREKALESELAAAKKAATPLPNGFKELIAGNDSKTEKAETLTDKRRRAALEFLAKVPDRRTGTSICKSIGAPLSSMTVLFSDHDWFDVHPEGIQLSEAGRKEAGIKKETKEEESADIKELLPHHSPVPMVHTCVDCGHSWDEPVDPRTCPKCRSPYWKKEKAT